MRSELREGTSSHQWPKASLCGRSRKLRMDDYAQCGPDSQFHRREHDVYSKLRPGNIGRLFEEFVCSHRGPLIHAEIGMASEKCLDDVKADGVPGPWPDALSPTEHEAL